MALSCVPPANHLLRKLDALLDLDLVRKQLEPFYSEMGRPSVDPELMIRMLLIGYCYSIRSERRLCDEVRSSPTGGSAGLASKLQCRTTRRSRSTAMAASATVMRFGRCSRASSARCMKIGLVGAKALPSTPSVVEADASRYQRVEGSEVDWTDPQRAGRPVRAYLAALDGENAPTIRNRRQSDVAVRPGGGLDYGGRHKVKFA